jgi:hypothetical protein
MDWRNWVIRSVKKLTSLRCLRPSQLQSKGGRGIVEKEFKKRSGGSGCV